MVKNPLEKLIPDVKKRVSDFVVEDFGEIPRHRLLALGSFLTSISVLQLIPDVAAAHTNSIDVA